jgi:hypothetical protein
MYRGFRRVLIMSWIFWGAWRKWKIITLRFMVSPHSPPSPLSGTAVSYGSLNGRARESSRGGRPPGLFVGLCKCVLKGVFAVPSQGRG